MRLVILETPYAADTPEGIAENEAYARRCMADCLERGEAPFASHLLYTQPGVLDDTIPEERMKGMRAGFAWGRRADASVFYVDKGVSRGMEVGMREAVTCNRPTAVRMLSDETPTKTRAIAGLRAIHNERIKELVL